MLSHSVMSDSCSPMDCSLLGSAVHGISQARILEWLAISSPGDLPDSGIEPRSPALQADSLPSEQSPSYLPTPQTLITTGYSHGKGGGRVGVKGEGLGGGRDCKAFTSPLLVPPCEAAPHPT